MRFCELTHNSILDVMIMLNNIIQYRAGNINNEGRVCNLYANVSMKITIKLHLTGKARIINFHAHSI